MKKAYRFDGVDQLEALVEKYGRDYFDYIPDDPGYLDSYPHKGGYIYNNYGYPAWTSGDPDSDSLVITFEEAMGHNMSIEKQIELAKSYIGWV